MDSSVLILAAAVLVLALYAFVSGGAARLEQAGHEAVDLLSSVWIRVLLGFALAGLITVLLPADTVSRHMGEGSGLTGLLLATAAGSLTPGGPFIQFPIVAALYRSGAGPGPLAAYLTAWSLIPVVRLIVWEVPFLGLQFAASRVLVSLAAPILVGLLAPQVMRLIAR